jgi:hypothetical protein
MLRLLVIIVNHLLMSEHCILALFKVAVLNGDKFPSGGVLQEALMYGFSIERSKPL